MPKTRPQSSRFALAFSPSNLEGVEHDLERFHFNRAIARIRELSNNFSNFTDNTPADQIIRRKTLEMILVMLSPMVPHLAEELWQHLGYETGIQEAGWPELDASLLEQNHVTLAIQVNGKLRATLEVARDLSEDEIKKSALALENVEKTLDGKNLRKVIYVPEKIINFVA